MPDTICGTHYKWCQACYLAILISTVEDLFSSSIHSRRMASQVVRLEDGAPVQQLALRSYFDLILIKTSLEGVVTKSSDYTNHESTLPCALTRTQ
jgi:hypothetical protein